jgi:hypothetical protein
MSNTSLCDARSLFMMLAEINEKMIDIRRALHENPAVRTATRGCDIRVFRDPMQPEEEKPDFESYVEVETQGGDVLWWRLTPAATSTRWQLHGVVGKPGSHGEDAICTFGDVVSEDLSDVGERARSLVGELADSARTFNFAL